MQEFIENVLGLKAVVSANNEKLKGAMELLIELRNQARDNRDFQTSDKIRDRLAASGITLKDGKEGTSYSV